MQRVEVSFVGFPPAEKIGRARESAGESTGNPARVSTAASPFSRHCAVTR